MLWWPCGQDYPQNQRKTIDQLMGNNLHIDLEFHISPCYLVGMRWVLWLLHLTPPTARKCSSTRAVSFSSLVINRWNLFPTMIDRHRETVNPSLERLPRPNERKILTYFQLVILASCSIHVPFGKNLEYLKILNSKQKRWVCPYKKGLKIKSMTSILFCFFQANLCAWIIPTRWWQAAYRWCRSRHG